MVMRIHETLRDPLIRHVDHFGVGRNGDVRANRGKAPVLYQNDLVVGYSAGLGINQMANPQVRRYLFMELKSISKAQPPA